jgi:hypothetical protein
MTLPLRIKQDRIQSAQRVRSPSHLAWVRSHACCVPGCKGMPIEAAHVRSSMEGGMGLKPGDDWTISLCAGHHREQHQRGEVHFEWTYGFNMVLKAMEFAQKSPKLRRKSNDR